MCILIAFCYYILCWVLSLLFSSVLCCSCLLADQDQTNYHFQLLTSAPISHGSVGVLRGTLIKRTPRKVSIFALLLFILHRLFHRYRYKLAQTNYSTQSKSKSDFMASGYFSTTQMIVWMCSQVCAIVSQWHGVDSLHPLLWNFAANCRKGEEVTNFFLLTISEISLESALHFCEKKFCGKRLLVKFCIVRNGNICQHFPSFEVQVFEMLRRKLVK